MADYIYLLENRLSVAQKNTLSALREIARAKGLTLFLVGGAVRDLTSGSPVRDLDVAVQGNPLKLRKELDLAGGVVTGVHEPSQTLYLRFGGVRVEVSGTMTSTYPKPGKPVLKPATILEDLRRRDFTANSMALSLNDGSYGLLMDPLNGVADIENRELRLVSNYGFIEEPVRLIRAVRFAARLGWTLEEKTQTRYETGKSEGYISTLQEFHRGYEAEEIVHEEDPLRVMRRLEAEGWMQVISPAWNSSKANVAELEKVRESQTQLQLQGIHPDPATVNFPLLTAKMSAKEVEALKTSFPRPGFVAEMDALEGEAKEFSSQLSGKAASTPSAAYRLIVSAKPEAVLYVAYTAKAGAVQNKLKSFFTEWPLAKQKIPVPLMQEMRIVPELPEYAELLEKLFFELMDGKLGTIEEMRAFLGPYSPPAPPPPVSMRRPRAARKDAKKGRGKKGAAPAVDDSEDLDDEELDDEVVADEDDEPEDEVEGLGAGADFAADVALEDDADEDEENDEDDEAPVKPAKAATKGAARGAVAPAASAVVAVAATSKAKAAEAREADEPAKGKADAVKASPKAPVSEKPKAVPAKAVPAKAVPVKVVPVKETAVKVVAKPPVKAVPAKAVVGEKPKAKAPAVPAKAPAKRSR